VFLSQGSGGRARGNRVSCALGLRSAIPLFDWHSGEKHRAVLFIGPIHLELSYSVSRVRGSQNHCIQEGSKSLFPLLRSVLGRPDESLWSGDGESRGAPAVARPAGGNGRRVVVARSPGDGGCAGDELGHAGDAPAAAQDRGEDAAGQRHQEGEAVRRRPCHAQRARRHRHRGHGGHPQRPARPVDGLRHRQGVGQAERLPLPLRRRSHHQVRSVVGSQSSSTRSLVFCVC
jgi:hypothetical protein